MLTAPGDVCQISEKIDLLLADPALRARLGKSARAKVMREFDGERNTDILIDRWAEIADRRRGLFSRLRRLLTG